MIDECIAKKFSGFAYNNPNAFIGREIAYRRVLGESGSERLADHLTQAGREEVIHWMSIGFVIQGFWKLDPGASRNLLLDLLEANGCLIG